MITLLAGPSRDLNWDIDSNVNAVWYLDFEWETLDPFDLAMFNANMLVIEEFSKQVSHAKKVVLARLNGNFSTFISTSEMLEARCRESGLNDEIVYAQILSEYLHRLASALPEHVEPILIIDILEMQRFAEMVLLFCRRRFEHFTLQFSNISLPIEGKAKSIISLPQDSKYPLKHFVSLFQSLKDRTYKCIPEEILNEHWEEVDYLIIDPDSMSDLGKRMLHGFEAAGGTIISTRGSLGFKNETSIEKFLISE